MAKSVSKANVLTLIISSSQVSAKGERIDRVLALMESFPSRSQLKQWFDEEKIRNAAQILKPSSKVFAGDEIIIEVPPPREMHLEPRSHPFYIFYEDDDLIVLYKPKGLSMHPGAGKKDETTLVHALLAHSRTLSDRSGPFRPGIVHRLDKDTEGIVVIAKDNETHEALSQQFQTRKIERAYWALCWGKLAVPMTIEVPIGRHPKQRKKMAVRELGKAAITEVRSIQYFKEGYSWVECQLKTGRTHQIRVHLSHKGFPLLGDPLYGKARKIKWEEKKQFAFENLKGQALCAFRLGFVHPKTGKKIKYEAEKPEWLKILTTEFN